MFIACFFLSYDAVVCTSRTRHQGENGLLGVVNFMSVSFCVCVFLFVLMCVCGGCWEKGVVVFTLYCAEGEGGLFSLFMDGALSQSPSLM